MAVVVIASQDYQGCDESKILWLLEDIWVYKNGDAELQLECILASKTQLETISVLVSLYVETIDDLTHLYKDPSFQYGYPQCWVDLYSQFEIKEDKHTVLVNGIEAEVSDIKVELGYRAQGYSEIKVRFTPPVSNKRIFRIGLLCKKFMLRPRKFFPWGEKRLRMYTYGMAPLTGTDLDGLLRERRLAVSSRLAVEKQILYIKLWEKEPIISCPNPPSTSYPFERCEFMQRYCPPLERMASHVGKEVAQLKKQNSYCIAWELENILPSKGQLITLNYFSSKSQKWLSEHWLTLFAFLLAVVSLLITLLLS